MVTPDMFAALSQKGFAEIELRARTKKALLDSLTEEELDLFAFLRSRAWCGTNEEEHEKGTIEWILETRTPAKKPLPKKIIPFL